MAFKENRKNVLIIILVTIIDILILFADLFIFYNKSLSDHEGSYTYKELFGVENGEYELYDMYKAYQFDPIDDEKYKIPISELFENVSINVVPQPVAEIVLLGYKGDRNLACFDLGYYFNFDNVVYGEEELSVLLDRADYLTSGILFLYNDDIYLYADFIAEPLEHSEKTVLKTLQKMFCIPNL